MREALPYSYQSLTCIFIIKEVTEKCNPKFGKAEKRIQNALPKQPEYSSGEFVENFA
ncbi:MAG: hypothetical protein Q3977_05480 [Oscillospiraceae bacterium]|nr:hypothetical protein [Oscillospiraceae bacterium]